MMGDKLRLEVVLAAVDRMSAVFRSNSTQARTLSKAVSENRRVLKELGAQRTQIDTFKATKDQAVALAERIKTNHLELAKLRREAAAAQAPSAALAKRMAALDKETAKLSTQYGGIRTKLNDQRAALQRAGLSTRDLASGQSQLNEKMRTATAAIDTQRAQLDKLNTMQRRAAEAAGTLQKRQALAAHASIAGYGAMHVGKALLGAAHPAIDEAKQFQTEETRIRALGLGEAASQDAIKYAKAMKSYGTSTTENLTLMRDAMTVFADEHHAEMVTPLLAKMKFANKAMYGEQGGADHDKQFMDMLKVIELRGGLASKEEFEKQANMVQKVLTATGGRVGADEWLQVIKTGGLAAKGLDSKAFYNQLEPLVQEMGGASVGTGMMSLYQNLYQGKTTTRAARNMEKLGLIGDMSKVKHDKAGQVSFMDPGALKGADLFRTDQFRWMKEVLLPQLASKGITEQKDVLDAIGSIVTNRKGSALLSQMYVQMKQIEKNAKLNDHADGIEEINAKAKQTASGKEEELLAKSHDAYLKVGNIALPIYTRALELGAKAMEKLSSFAEKHPTLTAGIIKVAVVFGGLFAVLGSVAIGLGAIIGPFAMLQYGVAMLGAKGVSAIGMIAKLGSGIGKLGGVVMNVGRLFMANPILLVVALIAAAAIYIWQNWDTLGPKFKAMWDRIKSYFSGAWTAITGCVSGIWSEVKSAFAGGIGGIAALILNWSPVGLFYRAFAAVMSYFGIDLPARFSDFGGMILSGLANGLMNGLATVKDAIVNAGESVVGWFKEKLGIHSPSRVFAELGGFTMAGLEQGLTAGQGGPLQAVGAFTKQLAAVGAGVALSVPALAAPALGVPDALSNDSFAASLDTRPPLAPQAPTAAAAPAIQIGSVVIHVTAAPGMDTTALAQEIRRQLEQLPRAGGYNASLRDSD
jgi:hypothetical protein